MINKKRKLLDADTTMWEVIQHSFVNFLYGFTSGVVIAFVALFVQDISIKSASKLFLTYFTHKQIESKVLNRNKYTTKLGKNLIFPFPSTIGFVIGAYFSTFLR